MNKNKVIFIIVLVFNLVIVSSAQAFDPLFSKQWYLQKIRATEAWSITTGKAEIVVAVIDSGVDIKHPDLERNIWVNPNEKLDGIDNDNNGYIDDINGWDFVRDIPDPRPKMKTGASIMAMNHGSFVAGVISAIHDNNQGIKGVTANVKIMPLLVLDSTGYGNSVAVSRAIDYAVKNGAHVINLSFGGQDRSEMLKNSIINAYEKGVLVVAASGNALDGVEFGSDMTNIPQYPICYDQEYSENRILGVASVDEKNKIANFTNYGKGCVDLVAPGTNMVSTVFRDGTPSFMEYYGEGWQGSSFSSALVSGSATLLKSVDPTLTPKQLIEILKNESGLLIVSEDKYRQKVGDGVLDIKKALDYVLKNKKTNNVVIPEKKEINKPVVITNNPKAPVKQIDKLYFSAMSDGNGKLRVFDKSLKLINEVVVFDKNVKGFDFVVEDLDGDGVVEIIAGGGNGYQGLLKIIDFSGKSINAWLPFGASFKGGLSIAVGDLDNDGKKEIVVSPKGDSRPLVKIYSFNGRLQKEFLAYNNDFSGGVNVAVGDVNGDKMSEIVTAPSSKLMPKIKVFNKEGKELTNFLAYATKFTGGVNISVADLDNDGVLDILCGAGKTGAPHVVGYRFDGTRLLSFFAYDARFTGGVNVFAGDWDGDGRTDILTIASKGGGPHLRIFNFSGKFMKDSFLFDKSFRGGGVIK